MPHLAPLSWALATLFFWTLLISLSATLWWQQAPSIPTSFQGASRLKNLQKWTW